MSLAWPYSNVHFASYMLNAASTTTAPPYACSPCTHQQTPLNYYQNMWRSTLQERVRFNRLLQCNLFPGFPHDVDNPYSVLPSTSCSSSGSQLKFEGSPNFFPSALPLPQSYFFPPPSITKQRTTGDPALTLSPTTDLLFSLDRSDPNGCQFARDVADVTKNVKNVNLIEETNFRVPYCSTPKSIRESAKT
ncbi:unnamed protein product [Soboliphyme baturini]|uniref:Expressed conserved protein n=1 Tax=Soboliphyme baturini TaxID=241478 RepID=A0A183IIW9_9BILA|nr:unnamed protein product [Soboliphyme baturini]